MVRKILLAATAVSALVIAGPAFAQASSSTTGPSGDHNGATSSSTTDVSIQASVPIDSNNSSTKTTTLDSNNSSTDNSTHSSTKSAALDSFNSSTSTDNSTHSSTKTDTLASNNTSNKTDTIASNNSSTKTTNNTSNKTATLDSYNTSTDNSSHTKNLALDSNNMSDSNNTNNSQRNGNWRLMAMQDLSATAAPVTSSGRSVSFSSGSNSISGSAFAAYAGILNQAWNTGMASNAQAATNIAAQGTITF